MDYISLEKQVTSLIDNETDMIANMANFSAFIYQYLPDINWAGFYLKKGDELVLGPFQGKVACIRIPLGKGVCGTSALLMESVLVEDVHKFPGHIACDSASNSELVVPVIHNGKLLAVFDIDSPSLKRFSAADQSAIERLVTIFIHQTHFEI